MRTYKRIMAICIAMSMVFTTDVVSVFAAVNENAGSVRTVSQNAIDDASDDSENESAADGYVPIFTVDKTDGRPGETVEVDISVEDNIGILGTILELSYNENLILKNAKAGDAFAYMNLQIPGRFKSPCRFAWDGQSCTKDDIKDGKILTLTFEINEDVKPGTSLDINIAIDPDDTYDSELEPITIRTVNGSIYITDYKPGDVNDDGNVDSLDVVLVRRYIVGGYDVDITTDAADVNNDLNINSADVTLMRRFITGGYNVRLLPVEKVRCEHEKQHFYAKEVKCLENGNIEYWYCSTCKKYYQDEEGKKEISPDNTIIQATGHTIVTDPAVPATPTSPGKTEGSHCSVCNTVIVPQQTIDADYFSIQYDVSNGDEFISTLNVENTNPTSIIKGGTAYLYDLSAKGYQFLGWYDASVGGNRIQKIENADHNYKLYAHWNDIQYTIQFKSDLVNADPVKYVSSEGKVLPSLSLDGYTFAGWSDDDGNIISRIKPGTTGNITLNANWISDRNQAWAKKKLDAPIIYENDDVILFAYEIGEIKNVPIDVIEDFGKINNSGVSQTVKKKYSSTTSESLMNQYTKTIASATTDTSSWTLSKDWSNTTSVNQEYCEENKLTQAEAENVSKSNTGEYYVTSSTGGSETTTTVDSTDAYDLHTSTFNKTTVVEDENHDEHVDETTHEAHLDVDMGVSNKLLPHGAKASLKVNVGGSAKDTNKDTSGTYHKDISTDEEGGSSQEGLISHHTTDTVNASNWNSESGYKSSSTTSSSSTVSSELSKAISQKTGYGSSYVEAGGESSSQGLTQTASSSDDYSNAVTYSTSISEETEVSYTTSNTKTGYHRWVMASTAHVFGVVGYDIATSSYFVYTYSIMDDERHKFEDYSYNTASYDDNENGIIDFSIPYEINDYVCGRVYATQGLEYDLEGTVTGYEGSDTYVVIPDYVSIDNRDGGRKTVVKVNKIAADAFRNNKNLTGIELSSYITEVPEYAFEGCSNLWAFYSGSLSSIGTGAFSGDKLLNSWKLGTELKSLGNGAFDSAYEIEINASHSDVVKNVITSNTKNYTINIENIEGTLDNTILLIPDGTESFTLNGHGKSFNDLVIKSNAKATTINRLNINSTGTIPLQLNSEKVGLYQTNVSNKGICMALKADDVTLDVYGTSNLTSEDDTAVLCKNCNIIRSTAGLATKINMSGDWACLGTPTGSGYLNFVKGSIKTISSTTFSKLLNSVKVYFDSNGGTCSENERYVEIGTAIGELPAPQKNNVYFVGWYTAAEGGNKVTDTTKINSYTTVYAHWTELNNPRKNAANKTVWDCVYFGSYPQGEVVESIADYKEVRSDMIYSGDLIEDEELYNKLKSANYDSSGITYVTHNGITEKYKRLKEADATYSSHDRVCYYAWENSNPYHYFKYEPLKWRILQLNGNDAFLMADKVIDNQAYSRGHAGNVMTWEKSTLRSWLNGYSSSDNLSGYDYRSVNFIDNAFSESEKAAISSTRVVNKISAGGISGGNNTEDKIYLLSNDEIMNTAYGFGSDATVRDGGKACIISSYAKAMGAYMNENSHGNHGNSTWNLRSPGDASDKNSYIDTGGRPNYSGSNVGTNSMGTLPVLHLDLSKDAWTAAGQCTPLW